MQAIEQSEHGIQELTLDAPVFAVTLLEDRAQVRRMGKVNLTPGLWRVRVEQVAPVLADKSLRAEYCGDYPGSRIDDVRVRRKMQVLEADRPAQFQALEVEVRSLLKTFNNITEDRQHLESTFERINSILAKGLQELPVDAIWGQIDPKSWREQLSTLFKQLRDLRAEILSGYHDQEDLSRQINDLRATYWAAVRPDMVYAAHIEADLMIPQAGEYEIAFDYVVPNAMWRPWHQARLLLEDQPSVSWRVDGCVWQRTGEDWHNVDLVRSTEYVGKTSVGFIAPGEKFALGWGPDAAMRVQRITTEKREQDHLTKWNQLTSTITLFLSNIGSQERVVKTTERIPVSELESVKVEAKAEKTTDGVQPDENGFCIWNFTLEPYSHLTATLVYTISADPQVQGL